MITPNPPAMLRLRWAVRGALTLGVAASVAANILHAQNNPIARGIAAWPPLALLLTVELVSRVPVQHRALGMVRIAATVVISAIAAFVSYTHMTGVAARYGETGTTAYLLPISVDGLIVVASICLVEIAARLRTTTTTTTSASAAEVSNVATPDLLATTLAAQITPAATRADPGPITKPPRPARPGIGEPTR
jgi:hypothetical protein